MTRVRMNLCHANKQRRTGKEAPYTPCCNPLGDQSTQGKPLTSKSTDSKRHCRPWARQYMLDIIGLVMICRIRRSKVQVSTPSSEMARCSNISRATCSLWRQRLLRRTLLHPTSWSLVLMVMSFGNTLFKSTTKTKQRPLS